MKNINKCISMITLYSLFLTSFADLQQAYASSKISNYTVAEVKEKLKGFDKEKNDNILNQLVYTNKMTFAALNFLWVIITTYVASKYQSLCPAPSYKLLSVLSLISTITWVGSTILSLIQTKIMIDNMNALKINDKVTLDLKIYDYLIKKEEINIQNHSIMVMIYALDAAICWIAAFLAKTEFANPAMYCKKATVSMDKIREAPAQESVKKMNYRDKFEGQVTTTSYKYSNQILNLINKMVGYHVKDQNITKITSLLYIIMAIPGLIVSILNLAKQQVSKVGVVTGKKGDVKTWNNKVANFFITPLGRIIVSSVLGIINSNLVAFNIAFISLSTERKKKIIDLKNESLKTLKYNEKSAFNYSLILNKFNHFLNWTLLAQNTEHTSSTLSSNLVSSVSSVSSTNSASSTSLNFKKQKKKEDMKIALCANKNSKCLCSNQIICFNFNSIDYPESFKDYSYALNALKNIVNKKADYNILDYRKFY